MNPLALRQMVDDLFATPQRVPRVETPASHRGDPEASRIAEAKVNKGARRHQAQVVLDALREHPDVTAAELARAAGLDRFMVSRRLPDLRVSGLAFNKPARVCGVTGNPSVVWRATSPSGVLEAA